MATIIFILLVLLLVVSGFAYWQMFMRRRAGIAHYENITQTVRRNTNSEGSQNSDINMRTVADENVIRKVEQSSYNSETEDATTAEQ